MNVIGKVLWLAFALVGIVAKSAHAQSVIFQCNMCTIQQVESLATSLGIGNHLIADFPDNIFYGYHVTREPNGVGGYTYELDPLNVTTAQQNAYSEYHTLIVTYHTSSIVVLVPNPRPPGYPTSYDSGSAVDWASNATYQNGMSNWFTNLQAGGLSVGWMGGAAATALLAMQSGISADGYKPIITFKIQTPSGSTITFQWNDGKSTLMSVVDQYGNTVPIRNYNGATNFNGMYNVSNTNPAYSQSLINYLNQLGAAISVNPSQFPVAIVCVSHLCTAQPN